MVVMNNTRSKENFVKILDACEPGRKLGHVWELMFRAAEVGWLQANDVDGLLDNKLDYCVEDLVFEVLPSIGKVRVRLVEDEDETGIDELLSALKVLRLQLAPNAHGRS